MGITYLDLLLKQLYSNRKDFEGSLFEDIGKEFKNIQVDITGTEFQALIYKLIDDGYVIKKRYDRTSTNLNTGEVKDIKPLYGAYISFNGILFFEDVPSDYVGRPYEYAQKLKRKKERSLMIETLPKRYWWAVAILAWVIGLLTDLIKQKYTKEKEPISIQQLPNIPKVIDTLTTHKTP